MLISLNLYAENPDYVWTLTPRADYEANKSEIITAQITLIQKRDWGTADDTNNVLHQTNFSAEKDGQEYCLFGYAVAKLGELLQDDYDAYTSALPYSHHVRGRIRLNEIEQAWGFTLTTNSWYTQAIPFVQDNPEAKKCKGFNVGYNQNENDYGDKDLSSICKNILNIADTEANRQEVDSQFNKTDYVYSLDTNILIYVWQKPWDKASSTSRKAIKQAEKQGNPNASAELYRATDLGKVLDRYKIKEKKK